jgi:hypothetical protein
LALFLAEKPRAHPVTRLFHLVTAEFFALSGTGMIRNNFVSTLGEEALRVFGFVSSLTGAELGGFSSRTGERFYHLFKNLVQEDPRFGLEYRESAGLKVIHLVVLDGSTDPAGLSREHQTEITGMSGGVRYPMLARPKRWRPEEDRNVSGGYLLNGVTLHRVAGTRVYLDGPGEVPDRPVGPTGRNALNWYQGQPPRGYRATREESAFVPGFTTPPEAPGLGRVPPVGSWAVLSLY